MKDNFLMLTMDDEPSQQLRGGGQNNVQCTPPPPLDPLEGVLQTVPTQKKSRRARLYAS